MEPQVSPPRRAKGHKDSCTCTLCARIKARIAAGLPTREEERAQRRAAKLAKQAVTKQQPRAGREQRIATDSAMSSSIATQIVLGHKPNAALAAKIAGVHPSTASEKARTEKMQDSIHTALLAVGITDARLAEVASEGLSAEFVRYFAQDGEVTDERRDRDWKSIHAFWRDLLMVKSYLGSDREDANAAPGGLMIINGPVQINTGHKVGCQCQECVKAWEEQACDVLATQARREVEMNIADVPSTLPAQEPERQAAPQNDDNDDWDDWG
jgi:hypothetical protein